MNGTIPTFFYDIDSLITQDYELQIRPRIYWVYPTSCSCSLDGDRSPSAPFVRPTVTHLRFVRKYFSGRTCCSSPKGHSRLRRAQTEPSRFRKPAGIIRFRPRSLRGKPWRMAVLAAVRSLVLPRIVAGPNGESVPISDIKKRENWDCFAAGGRTTAPYRASKALMAQCQFDGELARCQKPRFAAEHLGRSASGACFRWPVTAQKSLYEVGCVRVYHWNLSFLACEMPKENPLQ